ncbi:MAG: threonylcarbamoyl-AMP synthase [Phycisphaerales bacterium]|nr:threonylcarbamoyl-AMP synthase [Phycisphaerales bacterium]
MAIRTVQVDGAGGFGDGVRDAVDVLNGGGLVVFPTETVYGIAARADRPDGLRRLREAKDRTDGKPFTIHIGDRADAARYVPDMGPLARRLTKKAWPGPLTVLLTTADPASTPFGSALDAEALDAVYDAGTVGLRCPDSAAACDLLRRIDGPVAAASANRAGRRPARTVDEALADLNGFVDLALDGGPARHQRASTIVRIRGDDFEIVRDGVYDERMLRSFARLNLLFVCTGNTCRSPMAKVVAERLVAERLGCDVGDLAGRNIDITSAGTSAGSGSRAAANAVEVMQRRRLELNGHRSQPLTVGLANQADHIFVMTESHREQVLELVRSAGERAVRLAGEGDIDDPIGGDVEAYEKCASQIETALRVRLAEVAL